MSATAPFLLVRASSMVCAIPVARVAETMRSRPVTPLRDVPSFVRGVARLRGEPTPVLDLAELVTGTRDPEASRFVRLRADARSAALAVTTVLGVRGIELASAGQLPPLLSGAAGGAIEALGALDQEVFVALQVSRLVPEEVWAALSAEAIS